MTRRPFAVRLARLALPLVSGLLALAFAGMAHADGGKADTSKMFACTDLARKGVYTGLAVPVFQGDQGWFFRRNDLNHFYLTSPRSLKFLSRLRDALAVHGITLLLMPVPPKAILEPEHAVASTVAQPISFNPDFATEEFKQMVANWQATHLLTVDILDFIAGDKRLQGGDFFFARDIHWRPKLAQASAQATAELLLDTFGADIVGTKLFTTTDAPNSPYVSPNTSILSTMCDTPVTPETIDAFKTEQANQSVDSFLSDSSDTPPINVIGTSFTDESRAFDFAGFLRQYLHDDVATYSISGGGIDDSLYKYAETGLAASSGAKVLVWEIPYPERLQTATPELEREIIPAVAGLCQPGPDMLASTAYKLDASGSFTFPIADSVHAGGDNDYVAATLSDPTIPGLSLTLDYRDGRQDVVPLIRPDRVGDVPNLFAELSPDLTGELASVTIHSLAGEASNGTLSLCQYPAALRQAASFVQTKAR